MMAEYAHYYGGPPAHDMAWPLFLACLRRTGRYEARRQLTLFDSVRSAIGAAFAGEKGAGDVESARESLTRLAYPSTKQAPSRFTQNTLGGDDG